MPIPIVVIWGHRDSFTPLGWTARKCPRCRIVQPFAVQKRTRAHHIYYIHTKTEDMGSIVFCDFCDSAFGLGKNETPNVDANWSPARGLDVLIKSTNPSLPPPTLTKRPTQYELFALLEAANEKGGVLSKDISRPFMSGAMVAAPLAALLFAGIGASGLISWWLDALGSGMLGAMLGGLAGGIVWGIMSGRRNAAVAMREGLENAMYRHDLDKAMLEKALSRHPKRLGRVQGALAGLA